MRSSRCGSRKSNQFSSVRGSLHLYIIFSQQLKVKSIETHALEDTDTYGLHSHGCTLTWLIAQCQLISLKAMTTCLPEAKISFNQMPTHTQHPFYYVWYLKDLGTVAILTTWNTSNMKMLQSRILETIAIKQSNKQSITKSTYMQDIRGPPYMRATSTVAKYQILFLTIRIKIMELILRIRLRSIHNLSWEISLFSLEHFWDFVSITIHSSHKTQHSGLYL